MIIETSVVIQFLGVNVTGGWFLGYNSSNFRQILVGRCRIYAKYIYFKKRIFLSGTSIEGNKRLSAVFTRNI